MYSEFTDRKKYGLGDRLNNGWPLLGTFESNRSRRVIFLTARFFGSVRYRSGCLYKISKMKTLLLLSDRL